MNDTKQDPDDLEEEDPELRGLRARMEQLQTKLYAAKIAYLNRTELEGKIPEYGDLSRIAKELISSNYALQKRLYGKVRLKLSVSKLLRASNR